MFAAVADQPTCACGSGSLEPACCGPILDGVPATTAVALMRSRYTAYVRGAIDHVVATTDPTTRGEIDRDAARRWSRDTVWLGLEIVATDRGQPGDLEGAVEFIARGVTAGPDPDRSISVRSEPRIEITPRRGSPPGGVPFAQHERSRFRHHDGRWYYVDGKILHAPVTRVASVGRNDACPCGSGTKFKRCHGG
ncbi:MAG: hypothetical protein H6Q90_1439 [Deltaproteobacteria bacterium]|nr:hypothetical protein [Deltaproteobacteria bacterium]